ncbi:hypothetical protein DW184_12805 [Enterobacter cloacae]|nr:hypothetical protein DW184_12805 [Enterobacter cloacae]
MSIFERSKIGSVYFTFKCNNVLLVIIKPALRWLIYMRLLNGCVINYAWEMGAYKKISAII